MTDEDFISFVEALDGCWMQGRLQGLYAFLAEDVVFVAPGGAPRITGIAQAMESYRQFTSFAHVKWFHTHDHFVTQRGDTVIVEYGWEMKWVASDTEHNDTGREVLVLSRRNGNWRVVWRMQIPASTDSR